MLSLKVWKWWAIKIFIVFVWSNYFPLLTFNSTYRTSTGFLPMASKFVVISPHTDKNVTLHVNFDPTYMADYTHPLINSTRTATANFCLGHKENETCCKRNLCSNMKLLTVFFFFFLFFYKFDKYTMYKLTQTLCKNKK